MAWVVWLAFLALGSQFADVPPVHADITMPQSVIGSGGDRVDGVSHQLSCTVGQVAIGPTAGVTHLLGCGFWYQLELYTVGVGNTADTLPARFWLGHGFPNPFNPTTTLEFALPERCHVTIRLYDAGGRAIRTLVDRDMDPGYHKTTLHATGLASGIYYCRVSAGHVTETRTLALIK
jgi:hypothetical protein